MQLRLLKLVEDVRASYWFVPSLMAFAALVLGATVIYIDAVIGTKWLQALSWFQDNEPDGAREVLSTIAGSAITVAGVVFSITIVSVSFAASQYGPRVLTNFMSDRGNQVTLGTFIATFLYCLMVLRTIRGGDDNNFVPDLAILVALFLALCSIAVLIFFVHHVPRSIHVNTVIAGIGRQLIASMDERFPEYIGNSAGSSDEALIEAKIPEALQSGSHPSLNMQATPARSPATGYIEAIDDERVMKTACHAGLVIRLHYQPGDYIHRGRMFAEVWPRAQLTDKAREELEGAFAVSSQRTPLQDLRFLIDELVEVGTRALSPGVNDPFTAITCIDWLGAALSDAAQRKLPSPYRLDKCGDLRVIAAPLTFADIVDRALGQFRQYLATDKNACLHTIRTIELVAAACASEEQVKVLIGQAEELRSASREALDPSLFELVERSADDAIARLRDLTGGLSQRAQASRC